MTIAKVVLTDYVWDTLDIKKEILSRHAELVALLTSNPEEIFTSAKTF